MNPRVKILLLLSILGALSLTSCNTVSGVGRDLQRAGQGIEGAGGR